MPAATAFLQVANRASSVTAAPVDGVSDPVVVNLNPGDGALFPSFPGNPFHITIDDEILECTNRVADALTCTRAQEGTLIAAHGAGVAVQLRVTAQIIGDLDTAVNNCETVGAFTNEAETITAKWTWVLAAGTHIARRVGGDVEDRTYWSDAAIGWGTGAAPPDAEIGRGGANLLFTPDDFALGAAPASVGTLRLTNATYIYSRNAVGAANVLLLGLNGSDEAAMQAPIKHELAAGTVAFSAYVAGAANPKTTVEHGQVRFGAGGAGALDTTIARSAAGVVRVTTNLEIGGAVPATAGALRLPNATYIEARNAGNTADVILLGLDASNNIAMQAFIKHALAAGTVVLGGYVAGEANPKVTMEHGQIQFGAGGASALDVNLYRAAANVLKTDDAFHINNASGLLVNNIEPYSGDRVAFGATADRLGIPQFAGDPGALSNADIWYDSVAHLLKARIGGATVSLGAGNTPGSSPSAAHLFEEFSGGYTSNSSSGIVGELGWYSYFTGSGNITGVNAVAGHPGIMRLNATGSGYTGGLRLGSALRQVLYSTDYFDTTLMVRFVGTAGTNVFRTGLQYDDGNPSSNGLYLEKAAGDANFFMTSRSGGVDRTRTDTGIAVDGMWHKVRIRRVDAVNIGFTFDGGAEANHNVSIPVCALHVGHYLFSTAACSYDIDYMDLYVTGLAR